MQSLHLRGKHPDFDTRSSPGTSWPDWAWHKSPWASHLFLEHSSWQEHFLTPANCLLAFRWDIAQVAKVCCPGLIQQQNWQSANIDLGQFRLFCTCTWHEHPQDWDLNLIVILLQLRSLTGVCPCDFEAGWICLSLTVLGSLTWMLHMYGKQWWNRIRLHSVQAERGLLKVLTKARGKVSGVS